MISIPKDQVGVLVAGVMRVVANALQRTKRRALANLTLTVKSIVKGTT